MYGIHLSFMSSPDETKKIIRKYKIPCFQFFVKAPIGRKYPNPKELKYQNISKKYLKAVFSHAQYTVNLKSTRGFKSIINDLQCGYALFGNDIYKGTVVHPGSGDISKIIDNINILSDKLKNTEDYTGKVIIENTAQRKKPTESFTTPMDVKKLMVGIKNLEYIGFCFDTCHAYVTIQNDDRYPNNYSLYKFWKQFWHQSKHKISCIHLNDNDNPNADRHAKLFTGNIPNDELEKIIKHALKRGIPMIIEPGAAAKKEKSQDSLVKKYLIEPLKKIR